MIEQAFDEGILDRRIHRRIIEDIHRYAGRAGVPPEAICKGLDEYVGQDELEWVMAFLRSRPAVLPGLAYVGRWRDVGKRMVGIAGCMVRNFVDARVMTADQVAVQRPSCTLLLVPNFFVGMASVREWKASALVDVLVERLNSGRSTVVHVSDLEALKTMYGEAALDLVRRLRTMSP